MESSIVLDPAGCFVDRVPLRVVEVVARTEVTAFTGSDADHGWHEWDQNGHFHAWTAEGQLPTLRTEWHLDDCDEPDCTGQCYDAEADNDHVRTEARRACKLCGVYVVPMMRHNAQVTRRGLTSYSVRLVGGGELLNLVGREVTFTCSAGFGMGSLWVDETSYVGSDCWVSATLILSEWVQRRGDVPQTVDRGARGALLAGNGQREPSRRQREGFGDV